MENKIHFGESVDDIEEKVEHPESVDSEQPGMAPLPFGSRDVSRESVDSEQPGMAPLSFGNRNVSRESVDSEQPGMARFPFGNKDVSRRIISNQSVYPVHLDGSLHPSLASLNDGYRNYNLNRAFHFTRAFIAPGSRLSQPDSAKDSPIELRKALLQPDSPWLSIAPYLKLTVDASQLPDYWLTDEWLCERLRVDASDCKAEFSSTEEQRTVVLPSLPFVKILTVKESDCRVLLNTVMPDLVECAVPTPRSFGPNFKCPALKRIRFTGEMTMAEIKQCLDKALYVAIGAQPSEVWHPVSGKYDMTWETYPTESKLSCFMKSMDEVD